MKNKFVSLPVWVKICLLVLMIGALIYGGYHFFGPKTTTPTYQTATATKGTLIVSVTGSGTVSTANSSPVTTQASGVVAKVFVKDGDTVKQGQTLATITLDQIAEQKATQAYSSYLSAKNSQASAQASQLSLESQMWQANQTFINKAGTPGLPINDPTYIETNRDWLAAELKYKQQREVLAQSQSSLTAAWLSYQQSSPNIIAPINGMLTGFALQPGTVIATTTTSSTTSQSATKIATITTTASPIISLNLTEVDVPKIKIGNKATITFDAYPDKTYTGSVVSIDKSGVSSSGVTNYPTIIKLDTAAEELLPSMAASASIITNTKDNVLMVPTAAIQTETGGSTVRILKNGVPESVSVETGLSSDTQIEIISGLNEGDEVVTSVTGGNTLRTNSTSASPFGAFGNRGFGGGGTVRINRD